MKRLGVGVVGCGRIARGVHLPRLAASECLELVAVSDPDLSARRQAAGPGVTVHESLTDLLADDRVDAVVVASPPATHAPAAVAALAAGRHVYVEKPLAHTLDAARKIETAARERPDLVVAVGHNYRFEPGFQDLARRLREGRREGLVDEPLWLTGTFTTARRELPAWKERRETGGGALLDLASHHLDLLPLLAGRPPVAVSAEIRSRQTDDDLALLHLDFGDGLLATLLAGFGSLDRDRLEVGGEDGVLTFDRLRSSRVVETPADHRGRNLRRVVEGSRRLLDDVLALARLRRADPLVSYTRAFDAFARAVRGETAPDLATVQDGVAVLALIDLARQSAQSGR